MQLLLKSACITKYRHNPVLLGDFFFTSWNCWKRLDLDAFFAPPVWHCGFLTALWTGVEAAVCMQENTTLLKVKSRDNEPVERPESCKQQRQTLLELENSKTIIRFPSLLNYK